MVQGPEGFNTKAVQVEELSESELKFGYWFVTHKAKIKKIINICLIVFSVITYGYAILSLSWFYIFENEEYQQSLATLKIDYIDIQTIHQLNAIQPIQIISRHVLTAGSGKIDLAIRVKNPNVKWVLKSANYQFSHGGKFFDQQQDFLMPGEEKYWLLLNVAGTQAGTPQVFIKDQEWWRVTKYEEWGPERLNFLITNKKFLSAQQNEISDQLPVSEVSVEVTNATAYNYNEIEVQIALLSGTRLAGVSKIPLQNFNSSEKRDVSTRWTQALPSITMVEVIPTVNILDPASYKDYEADFDPSYLEIEKRRY